MNKKVYSSWYKSENERGNKRILQVNKTIRSHMKNTGEIITLVSIAARNSEFWA